MVAISKRDQLVADGFELFTIIEAGVPHFVWRCDLDLVHDRALHLSEETLLRLLDAGLHKREQLALATGLDEVILRNALLNLLERHAVEYEQDRTLRLSTVGKKMLLEAKVRLTSTAEGLEIRHDPYKDVLRWHRPEYDMNHIQMKAAGRRRITGVNPVTKSVLEERYREVQALLERDGLPTDRAQFTGKREVLRVHALTFHEVFRPIDLEVWFKPDSHQFGWRVVREGAEEPEVVALLEQLEADGAQVIPEEQAPGSLPISPANESLHEAASFLAQKNEPSVLRTHELRDAIRQAADEAVDALFIISPWLNRYAVNDEMTKWFDQALTKKPGLRIFIGYGIEPLPERPRNSKDERAHTTLRHLRKLGTKHGNRIFLTEIGNTHEKFIIVDDKYAVLASFNWLSFNPSNDRGPGVRREIGYRITQTDDVKYLLEYVLTTLQEADDAAMRA